MTSGRDLEGRILRVEVTKAGEPLELPITWQLAAIFQRRRADSDEPDMGLEGWLFRAPRKARSGHVSHLSQFYSGITEPGETRFWFHGLRDAFIVMTEREPMCRGPAPCV